MAAVPSRFCFLGNVDRVEDLLHDVICCQVLLLTTNDTVVVFVVAVAFLAADIIFDTAMYSSVYRSGNIYSKRDLHEVQEKYLFCDRMVIC